MGLIAILKKYREVKPHWEQLCHRCGQCCYERSFENGHLLVEENCPCEFLDPDTKLCVVYPYRFEACERCTKVTLRHALSPRYLPETCAYAQTFRPLLKRKSR